MKNIVSCIFLKIRKVDGRINRYTPFRVSLAQKHYNGNSSNRQSNVNLSKVKESIILRLPINRNSSPIGIKTIFKLPIGNKRKKDKKRRKRIYLSLLASYYCLVQGSKYPSCLQSYIYKNLANHLIQ